MMTSFDQIRKEAKAKGKKRIVVAPVPAAMDFGALSAALAEGLVSPIVIGSSDALSSWVKGLGKKASEIEIIEEPDAMRALALAIDMLKKGEADILMRGSLDPNRFLQAVLDKEKGLLKERVASLVSVFDPPGVARVTMTTDTYINSFPSIVEKVTITENVIRLARVLGFDSPKIAALSAIEQVNPAIPSTLDAAILSKMAERGQFGDVTLEGPLDIDCAVSRRAATRKGVHSSVTGQGDIYLVPNVEAGLLMAELSVFIGKTPMACALMGVSHPVVLNLPFVPAENRLTEIALAVLLCGRLQS
jgi:phosphate butyryltransferase